MRRSVLPWLVLWLLLPATAAALPGFSAGDIDFRFSGYIKSFSALTQGASYYETLGVTARETFYNNSSRVRLRGQVFLGETAEFAAHYEMSAQIGDEQRLRRKIEERYAASPFGGLVMERVLPEIGAPELFVLDRQIGEDDDYRVQHRLDRLYLKLHLGPWDLTLGRQALSWGPGRIWNPTDYLASFSPTEIDKEEKMGVDLAHARVAVHERVSLEIYAAPVRAGDDRVNTHGSAAAVKAALQALDAEWAISGGWFYDRTKAGFSVDGLLWQAGARAAVTRTTVEGVPNEAYYQAIVNVDYGWSHDWNPYLAVEYFYNGFGRDDPEKYEQLLADPAFAGGYYRGEIYNVGEHYLGLIFTIQPHALVTIAETPIFNILDQSLFNSLVVTWSVLQNFDWQFGAQHSFGRVPSEYGGVESPLGGDDIAMPDYYFTYLKYYF